MDQFTKKEESRQQSKVMVLEKEISTKDSEVKKDLQTNKFDLRKIQTQTKIEVKSNLINNEVDVEKIQSEKENISDSYIQNQQISEEPLREVKILTKSKPKNLKFRFGVVAVAFCAILTVFTGYSIYNAVELNRLNQEYTVNLKTYIKNIRKLEDIEKQIQNIVDTEIEVEGLNQVQIIETETAELSTIQTVTQPTNWFDRFIQGIRKIFGG